MSYIGTEPKDIRSFGRTKFDYTASQGQTAFTGADDDGKVLAFTTGQINVYVNGILMDDSDFTTTGTGTVTLASAANLNDVVNIVSFESNIPDNDYVPASGGTFTGNVTHSGTVTNSGNVTVGGTLGVTGATTAAALTASGTVQSTELVANNAGNNTNIRIQNTASGSGSSDGFVIQNATNNKVYIWNYENTDILFGTNSTTRMAILAAGGITFNGDTAAANALDDYEEGTWTPAPSSGTFSQGTAWYIKIGNMVHCGANIWNFSDRSSNNHVQSTVPFQAASNKNSTGSMIGRFINTGTQSTWSPYLSGGTSSIYFYRNPSDAGYTTLKHSDLNNSNSDLHFHITYESV